MYSETQIDVCNGLRGCRNGDQVEVQVELNVAAKSGNVAANVGNVAANLKHVAANFGPCGS
jgi:hypothetical protein